MTQKSFHSEWQSVVTIVWGVTVSAASSSSHSKDKLAYENSYKNA